MMRLLQALVFASALLVLFAGSVFAGDKLVLKNGEVLEGEIVEQTDAYVVLKMEIGGIERRVIKVMGEISSIELESEREVEVAPVEGGGEPAVVQRAPRGDDREEAASLDGATRVSFIRLGERATGKDMVGPFLNGNAIRRSAEILRELPEDEQPEIVVLEIDSGGGAVAELDDIIYAIQEDLKKDFRVVGWIRFAISGAAFTAMNCEELVFMSSGQMGGNVAFSRNQSGQTQRVDPVFEQRMLEYGRQVARNGRIDPKVMWSMQVFMTLSADIDESGRVTWYDTDQGEYLVSAEDKILTLNALQATQFGVAEGIADNKDELMRDVLGIEEWVEVGQEADEYQSDFRDAVWTTQARQSELMQKMEIAIELASGSGSRTERIRQMGRARQFLGQLKSLVRRAPSLEKYGGMTPEWFRQIEEQLREIQDQLT